MLTVPLGHHTPEARIQQRIAGDIPGTPRHPTRLGPHVLPAPARLGGAQRRHRLVGRPAESVLVV